LVLRSTKKLTTGFEAKPGETIANNFEAKLEKTVAAGFEAKLPETVTPHIANPHDYVNHMFKRP
jgi:hypothetical protein